MWQMWTIRSDLFVINRLIKNWSSAIFCHSSFVSLSTHLVTNITIHVSNKPRQKHCLSSLFHLHKCHSQIYCFVRMLMLILDRMKRYLEQLITGRYQPWFLLTENVPLKIPSLCLSIHPPIHPTIHPLVTSCLLGSCWLDEPVWRPEAWCTKEERWGTGAVKIFKHNVTD